jgi:hypothetical protein
MRLQLEIKDQGGNPTAVTLALPYTRLVQGERPPLGRAAALAAGSLPPSHHPE